MTLWHNQNGSFATTAMLCVDYEEGEAGVEVVSVNDKVMEKVNLAVEDGQVSSTPLGSQRALFESTLTF